MAGHSCHMPFDLPLANVHCKARNATNSPWAWAWVWAWGNLWQTLETAKTIMTMTMMMMIMMRKTRLKCFCTISFQFNKSGPASLQSLCSSTVTPCSTITPYPIRDCLSVSLYHAKHFLSVPVFVLGFSLSLSSSSSFCMHGTKNLRLLAVQAARGCQAGAQAKQSRHLSPHPPVPT